MLGFQTLDDGEGIGEVRLAPFNITRSSSTLKQIGPFIYIFPFKARYLHTKQSSHKIIQRPIISMIWNANST